MDTTTAPNIVCSDLEEKMEAIYTYTAKRYKDELIFEMCRAVADRLVHPADSLLYWLAQLTILYRTHNQK